MGAKTMAKRRTPDKEMSEHFANLIRNRIGIVLQMMYMKPGELVDLESGEEYICSVCDMEHKRCESEPTYRCEIARKWRPNSRSSSLHLGG